MDAFSKFGSFLGGFAGMSGTTGAESPITAASNRSVNINGTGIAGGSTADLARIMKIVDGPSANGGRTASFSWTPLAATTQVTTTPVGGITPQMMYIGAAALVALLLLRK